MGRWLMKFEVESDLALAANTDELRIAGPESEYEVVFRNGAGDQNPTLDAFVLFDSPTVDEAADQGELILRGLLRRLCFATGSRLLIKGKVALFEWDCGLIEHHGRIYRTFPDPNHPTPLFGPDLRGPRMLSRRE